MGVQFRGNSRNVGHKRRCSSRARKPWNGRPAGGAKWFSKGPGMSDHSPQALEQLMRVIAHDLKAVKPSPRPFRLALQTAPIALLISSVVLVSLGVRGDSGILGPLLTWGASAAQFALAIMLIWIAAHEGTPAGRLPRGTVYSALAATFLVVVGITVSTFSISPVGSTLRFAGAMRIPLWMMDLVCGVGSTVAGGILVFLFSRL